MEATRISPAKTLSRKPFMLMLRDDSGDLFPVKLDAGLAMSDNAIIVLDEYRDTTWVWIGRNVNMPTRMHALRMGKSVQKSGFKIGVTTIGMASTHLIEMLEKDSGDSEVASNIDAFREAIGVQWKFEDQFLAFDPRLFDSVSTSPIPGSPEATGYKPSGAPKPVFAEAKPEPTISPSKPEPVITPKITVTRGGVEEKAAFLLYSIVKHADLVYTERFEKSGKLGFKIEAPGTMVLEIIMDGDNLKIDPPDFGDSDAAKMIKSEFEAWLHK